MTRENFSDEVQKVCLFCQSSYWKPGSDTGGKTYRPKLQVTAGSTVPGHLMSLGP